jgi:adenosylcobinamide-GDP ribazoletransferase
MKMPSGGKRAAHAKAWIQEQGNLLLTGWMYFTRVPQPAFLSKRLDYSQASLERSAKYLPLFGIIIGAISGGVFVLADFLLQSTPLAVALSMVTSILLTGALHEDGLIDFFDAFGGGWWSRERILAIMKDSRVGSFGALAIILVLLIKFEALQVLSNHQIVLALIAAHAFSRFAAASFIATHEYVRENDQSYFKPIMKAKMRTSDFAMLTFFGMVPALFLGSLLLLCLLPVLWLIRTLFGAWFAGKIGGYTGDCLGATQQVVEICFYLALIVSINFAIPLAK